MHFVRAAHTYYLRLTDSLGYRRTVTHLSALRVFLPVVQLSLYDTWYCVISPIIRKLMACKGSIFVTGFRPLR